MPRLAVVLTLLAPLTIPLGVGVATSDARADGCSGTICDLFGGSRGASTSQTAAPAATATAATATTVSPPPGATVMTAPTTGGIFNFFRSGSSGGQTASGGPVGDNTSSASSVRIVGGHEGPCTGTFCDLYHRIGGGSSTSTAAAAPAAGAVGPVPTKGTATAPILPPLPDEQRQARNAYADFVEPTREAKQCHNASDPWHCYRR